MIQLGLASPQLFWQDFYEGEFPLPYQPCLREDLYRAYLAWCARYGEKMPKRINQFIPEFKSMNGVRFDRRRVKLDGAAPAARRDHVQRQDEARRSRRRGRLDRGLPASTSPQAARSAGQGHDNDLFRASGVFCSGPVPGCG
jgi:phage/plasmid-associated DNA primase